MKEMSLIMLLLLTAGCSLFSKQTIEHPPNQFIEIKNKTAPSEQIRNESQRKDSTGGSSSFFLNSRRLEHNALLLESGMAVAVFSEDDRCVLLTNKHLVHDATDIIIRPWSGKSFAHTENTGKERTFPAKRLFESSNADIALVEIERSGGCLVNIIGEVDPEPETLIKVYGQPVPGAGAVTNGIVSGYWHVANQGLLIGADLLTTPGFSGSGVFVNDNTLVGLVTGKTKDLQRGFAYLIPISRIFQIIYGDSSPLHSQLNASKASRRNELQTNR